MQTSAATSAVSAASIGAAGLTVTPLAGDACRASMVRHMHSFFMPGIVKALGPGAVPVLTEASLLFAG